METWAIALIVAGVAILVIVLLVLLHMLKNSLQRKKGVLAENLVTGKLNRFAKIRSFKVLENLTFPAGKNDTVTVDRALVTFNHVLLFQLRSECDTIYGDAKDPTWVSVKTDKENITLGRVAFDNPLREAQKANDAVRRLLTRHKLGKIQTEYYVVFGDPKVTLSIGQGMPVLNYKTFKALLSRSKYSEDGPVDVEEVAKLLQEGK